MDIVIFLRVYKNKVLNKIINNNIRYIHKKLYSRKYNQLNWNQFIESPDVIAQYGYFDLFKLLFITRKSFDRILLEKCGRKASRYGHLNILKLIIECDKLKPHSLQSILSNALSGGYLDIIEYIYSSMKDRDEIHTKLSLLQSFGSVADSGRIEVCDWYSDHLHENVNGSEINKYFKSAAQLGKLEVFKWGTQFLSQNTVINNNVWDFAISSRNIELLNFMYNHEQFNISFKSVDYIVDSVKNGNKEVIVWLLSRDDNVIVKKKDFLLALLQRGNWKIINDIASKFSHKMGIKLIASNEAEWFFEICKVHEINAINYAIERGKFAIMKWISDNTYFQNTVNPFIFYQIDGSMEILKWFTENNKPDTFLSATLEELLQTSKNFKRVEYIIRNRTEQFPSQISTVYRVLNVMEYVLWNSKTMELADWMLKHTQATCSVFAMDKAIWNDRLDIVKWIHENTTIGCTEHGADAAYFLKGSEMVEWLYQNKIKLPLTSSLVSKFYSFSPSVRTFIMHHQPEFIGDNVLDYFIDDIVNTKFIINTYPSHVDDNSRILVKYSKSGNIKNIKNLHEYYKKRDINHETNHFDFNIFKESLQSAIEWGHIEIVKYFCKNGPEIKYNNDDENKLFQDNPMLTACVYGKLDICKYLQKHTPYKLNSDHIDRAPNIDIPEFVQWISDQNIIDIQKRKRECEAEKHTFNKKYK